MKKGTIDGDVRDVVKGHEILSLMLDLVKEGSRVRVTRTQVRVDKRLTAGYNPPDDVTGESLATPG